EIRREPPRERGRRKLEDERPGVPGEDLAEGSDHLVEELPGLEKIGIRRRSAGQVRGSDRRRRLRAAPEALRKLPGVAGEVALRNRRVVAAIDPDGSEERMASVVAQPLAGEISFARPSGIDDPGPAGEAPGARAEEDALRQPSGDRGGLLVLDAQALGQSIVSAPPRRNRTEEIQLA